MATLIRGFVHLLATFTLFLLLAGTSLADGSAPSPELVASGNGGLGVSINSLGEIVWSQYDPITGKNQIFSSQRGQLTSDPIDHNGPSINNLGDVVWISVDNSTYPYPTTTLQGIIDGQPATVYSGTASFGKVTINDRGEVIFSQNDYTNTSQLYSKVRGQLTHGAGSWNPSINKQGDIVFTQNGPSGTPQVFKLPAGSTTPVEVTNDGLMHMDVAVNDVGEMVWGETDPASWTPQLTSNLRGVLVSNVQLNNVGINNCGDVVYTTSDGSGMSLYRLGQNSPCFTYAGPQGSQDQATPVAFGDIFTALADGSSAPVGWYRFDASAGDTIYLKFNYDSRPPNTLSVGLYDGQGNLLSGPTSTVPLAIRIPASYSGSYYLKVQGEGGRFGYSVSLGKYSNNCGAGPCPELVASGNLINGPISINSLGESVWSQFDPATGKYQIFSSRRGQLTSDPVDHQSPALNSLGDLVWISADNSTTPWTNTAQGIIGGKPVTFATSQNWISKIDLNDRGEVVWSQNDYRSTSQIYSSLRGQLTNGVGSWNPSINNAGDLTFIQYGSSGAGEVYRLAAGSSTPVAITDDALFHGDVAHDDAGEVVWSEIDPTNWSSRLVSSLRGGLIAGPNISSVDLNSCGDVLYTTFDGGVTSLYRLGENSPCFTYTGGHASQDQAASVSLGDVFTGLADAASAPVSWYRFDATAGDTIYIKFNYDSRPPNLLNVGLYDGQGNLLSGPTSTNPLAIQLPASYSGSYYLKVEGQGARFGYSVSLSKYSYNCGTGPCPEVIASGNLVMGVSLNSLGEAVWSQLDQATGKNQIFSSQRGRLTSDPVDHYSPAINSLGDLVWVSYDSGQPNWTAQGIIGGKSVTFTTSQNWIGKIDLNDRGEVVWSVGGNVSQLFSNIRGVLFSAQQGIWSPSINNKGDVLFLQYGSSGQPQVYKLTVGSNVPVAVTDDAFLHSDAAVNDAGEVVWGESDPATSSARLVSSVRGVLTPANSIGSVDVNSCGDVLYTTFDVAGISLYRLGENSPCATYTGGHASQDQAASVTLGDIFTGVADGSGAPVSWYRFDASAGDTIYIKFNYDSRPPNLLNVGLYDGQGNLLSGPTSTTPLAIQLPASYSGSYYLKVAGQGGRFGYSVSLSKYSYNCGAGPCPEVIASGNLMMGVSLNALGEAVWSQLDQATGKNQIFSSQRGRLTSDPVDHYSPAINNLGDLVWISYDNSSPQPWTAQGIIGGKGVTFATSLNWIGKIDVNDRGEVVWGQSDDANVNQVFSSIRGQLTSVQQGVWNPGINNKGDVLFIQYGSSGQPQVYKLAVGGNVPVAVTDDAFFHSDAAVNDAGEVVWGEADPATSSTRLVSSVRGVLTAANSIGSVDVNSCGDVLYTTFDAAGISLYRLGENSPCVTYTGANATQDQAAAVSFGDTVTGLADSAAVPVAWYRFDASAGDPIAITANYDNRAPNAFSIGLYDGQGNLLSGPTSSNPLGIQFTATATGSYYVKVQVTAGRFGYAIGFSNGKAQGGGSTTPPSTELSFPFEVDGINRPASMNSLGEVVWSKRDASGKIQIFSSTRGQLTSDASVDHLSPAINDLGDTVWVEESCDAGNNCLFAVKGVIAQQQVTVVSNQYWIGYRIGISNQGEVVWSQADSNYDNHQVFSSVRGQLTSGGAVNRDPAINNRGDVVYTHWDGSNSNQVYTIPAGSSEPVAVTSGTDRGASLPSINDSGEIMWLTDDWYNNLLVSSTRGTLVESDIIYIGSLNNCGDVLYQGSNSQRNKLMLYRVGNASPCGSVTGSHDTVDQAAPVSFGDTFTGLADSAAAPVAWYRFDASTGDTVHLTINYDNRSASAIAIGLYDAQGNLVASPAGSGPARIDYTVPAAGAYYLKVVGQSGRVGYAVSARRDAAPPSLKLITDGQPDAYFSTLADLFGHAPAAASFRLLCRSGDFGEDVSVDLCGDTVTISGGYDFSFAASTGASRIDGALRVKCGKVVADGIAIR